MKRSDSSRLQDEGESGDGTDTFEALCLSARAAARRPPQPALQASFERLADAICQGSPAASSALTQTARLLSRALRTGAEKTSGRCGGETPRPAYTFRADAPVLLLAGSTDAQSDSRLAVYEPALCEALAAYTGYLVTGGTAVGVCRLAARCAARANASGTARITLVGYLPAEADASPDFPAIVRTCGRDFSLLEPLQMWSDLLSSGPPPASIALLCLGGGVISSQELALAWALGARVAALAGPTAAPTRFAALLARAGADAGRGAILPDDPAALRAFIPFGAPSAAARVEAPR